MSAAQQATVSYACAEQFMDALVRIDSLIWLAGACSDEFAVPEALSDFWDDIECSADGPVGMGLPKDALGSWGQAEFVSWCCREGKFGLLAKVATPFRTYTTESICKYSWGDRRTHWIYGESLAEIAAVAILWAAKCAAEDKAKFAGVAG